MQLISWYWHSITTPMLYDLQSNTSQVINLQFHVLFFKKYQLFNGSAELIAVEPPRVVRVHDLSAHHFERVHTERLSIADQPV